MSVTSNVTSEAYQATVRAWLLEEGYQVESQNPPDAHWVIVGTDDRGRPVAVGQKAERPDRLVISATSAVAPEHQSKFDALPKAKRDQFLWDMRFALLRTDVEFEGLSEPLGLITVAEMVYFDALNKDTFMQRVSQVRKAQLLVLWKLQQLFEETPERLGFSEGVMRLSGYAKPGQAPLILTTYAA